jgi:glucokinase
MPVGKAQVVGVFRMDDTDLLFVAGVFAGMDNSAMLMGGGTALGTSDDQVVG